MDDKLFWEKYFLTYDILNEAIPYQKLMGDLIEALKVDKGNLIFDAGSGTGNLCIRLKECGSRPIGFDFSERAISIHKKKDQDAEVVFGDLTLNLPFRDNYFDKVVSNNVLYTINKTLRLVVMKEFYRILKPNGTVVIANVHTGFNPLVIFMDHLRQSKHIKGIWKTAIDFGRKSYAVWKMFYYSLLLIRKDRNWKFAFMEKDEQKYLLSEAGFKNVAETLYTYSNQSYLDVGVK
jgi:ubiquinone/menaquinone biosynthesis C-methylase UbiE